MLSGNILPWALRRDYWDAVKSVLSCVVSVLPGQMEISVARPDVVNTLLKVRKPADYYNFVISEIYNFHASVFVHFLWRRMCAEGSDFEIITL